MTSRMLHVPHWRQHTVGTVACEPADGTLAAQSIARDERAVRAGVDARAVDEVAPRQTL